METFSLIHELLDQVSNRERYDFAGAVELARNGLMKLGFVPEDLLFKHTEIVVVEPYHIWKYTILNKAVIKESDANQTDDDFGDFC